MLSHRGCSFFITALCIAAKSLLIFYYTYTGKDKIYSLSASYNLLHGKGWTNSFYYAEDVSREVLIPFCHWPPGYGLLFTPFQILFGENIFLGTAVLEVLGFIAFILLCRGILATQHLSRSWINLSTILLSFYSHDFIEASLGTDLLALVFLMGFFYCSLLIWRGGSKSTLLWLGLIAGACLFFAGFTRYMYVPIGLFLAILMPVVSYWKKNKIAMPAFLLAMAIGVTGLVAAMFVQDAACGSPFYTGIKEQGIFWNNLSYWHPAAIAAFTDMNFVPVQLSGFTGISFVNWLRVFNFINWLIYLWIIIAVVRYVVRHWNSDWTRFPLFELLGSIISAAIIAELAVLSLFNGLKYTVYEESWTFIIEGRYHAFATVFMQLFLLKKVAAIRTGRNNSRFYKFIFAACFFLLVLNSIHQVYFTAKVGLNYQAMKANSTREQDYVFFERLLKSTREQHPDKEILVVADDRYYMMLASMLNAKGILDAETLNSHTPAVDHETILFFIFYGEHENQYQGYLQNNDIKLLKEVAGTRFYMQILGPR